MRKLDNLCQTYTPTKKRGVLFKFEAFVCLSVYVFIAPKVLNV